MIDARRLAEQIYADVCDRRGINLEFERFKREDPEVYDEILSAWTVILQQAQPAADEQPPAQDEPKLEMPATVGAFTFNTGVSERLVIEAAQRQYEYSRQPEQIEAREERLRGFIDELHKSEPSPDTEQQRRDAVDTLRKFAEGRITHHNNGLCPDVVEGYGQRDLDCAVCQALAAIEAEGKWPWASQHITERAP